MDYKDKKYWALILGGSSGFGLASAKKLASQGMNICVVHRDRKGAMARIEEDFTIIRNYGVELLPVNTNALTQEGREQVLASLSENIKGGTVRLLMHSIALGNLKPIAPVKVEDGAGKVRAALAKELGVSADKLKDSIQRLFEQGLAEVFPLADDFGFDSEMLMEEEDMAQTVYAMGTSLLTWTQELFAGNLFADDARVLAMTSEGNTIAWRAYGAVSAAKTALESVSRSIAVEFAPHGIRSNVIQAGSPIPRPCD